MDKNKVLAEANKRVAEEQFQAAVSKKVDQLKWHLWKRLWPYKIKIQVIDLREEE